MTEKTTFIPARLKSSVVGGHVAGAADIIDDVKGKTQDAINEEVDDALDEIRDTAGDLGDTVEQNRQDAEAEFQRIKGGSNKSIKNLDDEIATKQSTLEFDNSPALGSNNPVKSDGIKRALNEKQDALEFENLPTDGSAKIVRSGGIKSYVDSKVSDVADSVTSEEARARAAEQQNASGITDINNKIPSEASSQNQLADKNFVNSSVGTNTANYISNGGEPFNSFAELEAYSGQKSNNDYAFVKTTDASGNTLFKRYKYNASTNTWAFEYELNNSSFTSAQWEAINSGITLLLKNKLVALPTYDELVALLAQKQNVIDDLSTIRQNAQTGAQAYQKPSAGIPSEDMTSEVRQSLSKADTALQQHQSLDNYYNKAQVDDKLSQKQDTLTIDQTPTINSGNPISSDAVYDVQQALTAALNGKQATLTFDLTPTLGSGNPVTSGGVFAAIASHAQIRFVEVETLPEPSEATLGRIYLIKDGPASYRWYVTIYDQQLVPAAYVWRLVDSNSIDLSDYYTIEQVDALLASLANEVSGKADKSSTVTSVDYDSTKLTKTINGTTSDVLTLATLKQDMGLNNVANIDQSKAVKAFSVSGNVVTYTCLDNTTGTFLLPKVTLDDVYIGAGTSTSDVMISGNFHASLRIGEAVSVTSSGSALWVILPSSFYPVVLMEGVKVPMTAQQDIEQGGIIYKVLKSDNTFTGSFNVILM